MSVQLVKVGECLLASDEATKIQTGHRYYRNELKKKKKKEAEITNTEIYAGCLTTNATIAF